MAFGFTLGITIHQVKIFWKSGDFWATQRAFENEQFLLGHSVDLECVLAKTTQKFLCLNGLKLFLKFMQRCANPRISTLNISRNSLNIQNGLKLPSDMRFVILNTKTDLYLLN